MTITQKESIFQQVAEGRVSVEEALNLIRAAPAPVQPSSPDLVPFVLRYFTDKIAAALSVSPGDVDAEAQLMDLGLDSAALLKMADELENELGITLYPTVFFEHTTLSAIARHFAVEHGPAFEDFRGGSVKPPEHSPIAQPALGSSLIEAPQPTQKIVSDASGSDLVPFVLRYFTDKIAAALSVSPGDVDAEAQLMDLGLDSAALLKMADELENELGITLYPTVFFEHTTLSAIARHFAVEHGPAFAKLFGVSQPGAPAVAAAASVSMDVNSEQTQQDGSILRQVVATVADVLSVTPQDIDADADLMDLGLDSAALMALAERLESSSSTAFNPALFFEHRTLRSLAKALAATGFGASSAEPNTKSDEAPATPPQEDTCFFKFQDIPLKPASSKQPLGIAWLHRGGTWAEYYSGSEDDRPKVPLESLVTSQLNTVCYVVNPELPGNAGLNDLLKAVISDVSNVVALLGLKFQTRIVLATPTGCGHATAIAMGLSAFLKSVCLEYGNLKCLLLETDDFSNQGLPETVSRALGSTSMPFAHLRATSDSWTIRQAVSVDLPTRHATLRRSSVTLISGGAGALGLMFARHFLATSAARVILIGRRREMTLPPDLVALAKTTGGEVHYKGCDITDLAGVQSFVDRIVSRFGTIDCVIHAAGVIDDQPIARKTDTARAAVIDPKVAGVLNLDAATRHLPLDFFVCFSSIAGFTGNKGQSDYAPANGFLDGFMMNRVELAKKGLRSGRSMSINWPLWAEGGMQPNLRVRDLMRQHLGLGSLTKEAGLACFDRALADETAQIAVLAGDVEKIRGWIAETNQKPDQPAVLSTRAEAESGPIETPFTSRSEHTGLSPKPVGTFAARQVSVKRNATLTATSDQTSIHATETAVKLDQDDLAIVGMACRLPGSPDVEHLWKNLLAERDLISARPDRWTFDRYIETIPEGEREKIQTLECGYMDDVIGFDPDAFNISMTEAERMDPQQRLALVCAWHALENAGYDPKRLRGQKIGVFVASSTRDFQTRYRSIFKFGSDGTVFTGHTATGFAANNIPNRISYLLDITGPSELVDTACSSSLVALSRARDAVRLGQCDSALVIGVNVILEPMTFAAFSETGLLSKSNRCKAFGVDGTGYVRAEGVGAVVVKPYSRAVADGDTVQALVRGIAINHGGRVQSLTAPNPRQQAAAIARALTEANIDPATVDFVEAHGTGTALGDSVEILGLKSGFKQAHEALTSDETDTALPVGTTRLGSIKSNLGHLEAAAGMAGLVKVLLSLRHRILPKSLHCEVENPMLDLAGSPFVINHDTVPLPRQKDPSGNPLPLRAGLSSFGFGGTNGHAVLEEPPVHPTAVANATRLCIPVSALDKITLRETVGTIRDALGNPLRGAEPSSLADIALTLSRGRTAWPERLCFVATCRDELVSLMARWLAGETTDGIWESRGNLHKALRGVLKPSAIDALSGHYMESGDPDGLAAIWVAGVEVDLGAQPGLEVARRIQLPGTCFRETPCWPVPVNDEAIRAAHSPGSEPVQNRRAEADIAPTHIAQQGQSAEGCHDFILKAVAAALGRKAQDIDPAEDLVNYGFDSILAMQLLDQIKAAYDIPVFVAELRNRRSVNDLANYVVSEVKSATASPKSHQTDATDKTLADPIFLLSAPRSGSTLLRTMLMGHSSIYAPPELHLLGFETMGSRARALDGSGLGDGLIEALADLQGIDAKTARSQVSDWEAADLPISEVYARLIALCKPRRLVDKSPSYGASAQTLARGHRLFPKARYLHLIRRPEAMMTSFVLNRFHKLIGAEDRDPWQVSDTIWVVTNEIIADFAASLPPNATMLVHYETLVAQPRYVAEKIVDWLGIGFDEAILEPYGPDRMTQGLAEKSLSVGDPNFLEHDGIDASQACEWLQDSTPVMTGMSSPQVAQRFGYDTGRQIARIDASREVGDWLLTVCFDLSGIELPSSETLQIAVIQLMRAWPILGMRLDPESGQLTSQETGAPAIRLTADGPPDSDWTDHQARLVGHVNEAPFALEMAHADKAGCVFLTLLLNHHACDGASAMRVAMDFVTFLKGEIPSPGDPHGSYTSAASQSVGRTTLPTVPAAFQLKARHQKRMRELTEYRFDLTTRLPKTIAQQANLADAMGAGLLAALMDTTDGDEATILLRFHGRTGGQSTAIGNFAIDIPIGLNASDLGIKSFAAERTSWSKAMSSDRNAVSTLSGQISNVRLNFQDIAPLSVGSVKIELHDAFEARGAVLRIASGVPLLDLILRRRGARLELIVRCEAGAFRKTQIQQLIDGWIKETIRLGKNHKIRATRKKGNTKK